MKRARALAGLLGLLVVGAYAAEAAAMYHTTVGRFVHRDPRAISADRSGAGSAAPPGESASRAPQTSNQYVDGMGLYQYVSSAPVGHSDPRGLQKERQGPCVVKQVSGPDGDGSLHRGPHMHLPFIRHSHAVRDSSGAAHKKGHTWLSCQTESKRVSAGFYPMDYANMLIPATGKVWGVNDEDTQKANERRIAAGETAIYQPYDPLDEPGLTDMQGEPTSHDWEWDTKLQASDKDKLQHGAGKGDLCCQARDEDIVDCVRQFAIEKPSRVPWIQRRFDVNLYNCQDFVLEAMERCCLALGERRGPLAGPDRCGD